MKHFVSFLAFAVVALLTVSSVFAAGTSATLSWQLADSYIDGAPLAAANIKETLIEWRRPGNTTVVGSVRVAAPAITKVVPGLVCGNFEFVAYTITVAPAESSDASTPPVVYATGVTCKANPPKGLGAT